MVTTVCPNCTGLLRYDKSWELKGRGNILIEIEQWKCQKCGAILRIPKKKESNFEMIDDKGTIRFKS
jgi:RNase P subunit RPR2